MTAGLIRDAGDSAVLLELEPRVDPGVNARAIAIASAFRAASPAGVRDVVATYRSVAVYFDPLAVDVEVIRQRLLAASATSGGVESARCIDVPVVYGGPGGPDLELVARFAGLTPEAAARLHASTPYRVFMLGFLPGFPYMGLVDARIALGRRASPRLRVPAGSVGIAGRQTGIYPRDSPGGWQIVGRTALDLFNPARVPPNLLAPGDQVRFQPAAPDALDRVPPTPPAPRDAAASRRALTVLQPGLFTTVQDEGRWGHQASGVSVSGALDLVFHRVANALVGNDRSAATLEITVSGPELRLEAPVMVAVAGADLGATVDGAPLAPGHAAMCRAGAVVRFGARAYGARTYLAVEGGVDTMPVLGSRSTHVRSGLGGHRGRALVAGDRLPLGKPRAGGRPRRLETMPAVRGGGTRLRVLPGPQAYQLPQSALDRLQNGRFIVSTASDRMGYRLRAGTPLPSPPAGDMISDAAFTGGVQVPPAGDPILLMADRQTSGGYPQLAVVITADLPRAAQLLPGDWVEFEVCTRGEAMAALVLQEERLGAAG